jgi:hypothetical protein
MKPANLPGSFELEGAWHFSGTGSAVGLPAIPQNI